MMMADAMTLHNLHDFCGISCTASHVSHHMKHTRIFESTSALCWLGSPPLLPPARVAALQAAYVLCACEHVVRLLKGRRCSINASCVHHHSHTYARVIHPSHALFGARNKLCSGVPSLHLQGQAELLKEILVSSLQSPEGLRRS